MYRALAIAGLIAALTIVAVSPVADASTSLARKVAQALSLAKRADTHASAALDAAKAGPKRDAGAIGPQGQAGAPGASGPAGAAGTNGAPGAKGDTGAAGANGTNGTNGTASLNLASATNPGIVDVSQSPPTTVVSLSFSRAADGAVFVMTEGQANGENATSDGMLCDLRLDGTTVEQRFVKVRGNEQVMVAASTVANLTAGSHTATFACARQASGSNVSFPGGRTRLTVVGG
jgi:hypothetical protein